jgi:hypothetical protein
LRFLIALIFAGLLLLPSPVSAYDPGEGPEIHCPPQWPDCRWEPGIYGYWWHGYQVPGLVSIQSWLTPAPLWSKGGALYYAPHIMEATAAVRGMSLDGYVDGVAVPGCADLGQRVWLKRPGHTWEGPFLVVDCAARNDMYGQIMAFGEMVEVGFDTALRWGMAAWVGYDWVSIRPKIRDVEMSKVPPALLWRCDGPTDFATWWQANVIFTDTPREATSSEIMQAIEQSDAFQQWQQRCAQGQIRRPLRKSRHEPE